MSVESASGNTFSGGGGDYAHANLNNFTSTGANLNLGSYVNYAALANASYNIGQSISGAGNPYFGLGNILAAINLG